MSRSCPEDSAALPSAGADEPELTDADILDAMRHVPGYIDISTEDFRTIYQLAWQHARTRVGSTVAERTGPAGWRGYWHKWRGVKTGAPPRIDGEEIFWSWLGALLAIGLLAWLGQRFLIPHGLTLLIAPFGASAVLLFGAPRSQLAQPRNLLGGHAFSALMGVLSWKLCAALPGLSAPGLAEALSVATALAVMHLTRTLHPPGGATALTAVIGGAQIHALGFSYVFIPVTLGALILLAVGLVFNNLPRSRRYPEFWF